MAELERKCGMNPLLKPLKDLVRVIRNFEVGDFSPIMDELFDAEEAIEIAEKELKTSRPDPRQPRTAWLTTLSNPRIPATGFDAGQRGWRLHAVTVSCDAKLPVKGIKSVCGLTPRHGWGLDLFIEEKCSRCAKKLGLKRSLSGEWLPERIVNEQEPVMITSAIFNQNNR